MFDVFFEADEGQYGSSGFGAQDRGGSGWTRTHGGSQMELTFPFGPQFADVYLMERV